MIFVPAHHTDQIVHHSHEPLIFAHRMGNKYNRHQHRPHILSGLNFCDLRLLLPCPSIILIVRQNCTYIDSLSVVMYGSNKACFVDANVENRKSPYLIGVRRYCAQRGKGVKTASSHQSIPVFYRCLGIRMFQCKFVESFSCNNVQGLMAYLGVFLAARNAARSISEAVPCHCIPQSLEADPSVLWISAPNSIPHIHSVSASGPLILGQCHGQGVAR